MCMRNMWSLLSVKKYNVNIASKYEALSLLNLLKQDPGIIHECICVVSLIASHIYQNENVKLYRTAHTQHLLTTCTDCLF